jgi:hypothetical protein
VVVLAVNHLSVVHAFLPVFFTMHFNIIPPTPRPFQVVIFLFFPYRNSTRSYHIFIAFCMPQIIRDMITLIVLQIMYEALDYVISSSLLLLPHIHTYIHTYIHTHIHTHTHTHTHTYIHTYILCFWTYFFWTDCGWIFSSTLNQKMVLVYERALGTVRHHPSHNATATTCCLHLTILCTQPRVEVLKHCLYRFT